MSDFNSDADRALFTSITASLIRLNKNMGEVKILLEKHLDTANSIKEIHEGMMDIFRTMATFMSETPDLLNGVVGLATETKAILGDHDEKSFIYLDLLEDIKGFFEIIAKEIQYRTK